MKAREALRALAEITESQWGLVTSAQARAAGLVPMDLTRLTQSGDLVRITHGVYRDAGAPADQYEDLRGAWLSTDPSRLAYQRLRDRHPDAVVSGESAAKLHNIGDFRPDEMEISVPQRRRSRREDVRFRTREVETRDSALVQGLPVTSLERTLADLVCDGHDLSLVANAMSDALRQSELDDDHLAALLAPVAHERGFARRDGEALLRKLKELAGTNNAPLVELLTNASPLLTQVLETTARAAAQDPNFARLILLADRQAELPTLLRSLVSQEALEPREAAVQSLMDSAALMVKAIDARDARDNEVGEPT